MTDANKEVNPYKLEKMRLTGGDSKPAAIFGLFAPLGFSLVFLGVWIYVGGQLWVQKYPVLPAEITLQE